MGSIRMPAPVCPILALTYQQRDQADHALEWFKERAGEVSTGSEPFAFTHTRYYEPEMGSDLTKIFYAFVELMDPADLVSLKLHSNQIEERLSVHGRRRVNLDPGYLEAAKLILATTKNFSHRIYLGQGIYGDVQLYWRDGRFQSNPWTYPDYQAAATLAFFTRVRDNYLTKNGDTPWPSPTSHLA
ncbi:DUF4416 family protein [bacterium]|nr:DUF4416 family protein [bacterium]